MQPSRISIDTLPAVILALLTACAHPHARPSAPETTDGAHKASDSEVHYARILPVDSGVETGHQIRLTATEMSRPEWKVAGGTSNGTISKDGVFTAPTTPGWVDVYAIDAADRHVCASASISVHPPGSGSTEDLLNKAVSKGKITQEEAFVYYVYAVFRDPRLPLFFRGDDSELDEHSFILRNRATFESLPPEKKDLVEEYFHAGGHSAWPWPCESDPSFLRHKK